MHMVCFGHGINEGMPQASLIPLAGSLISRPSRHTKAVCCSVTPRFRRQSCARMTCRRPLYGCEVSPPGLPVWSWITSPACGASFFVAYCAPSFWLRRSRALWAGAYLRWWCVRNHTGNSPKGFFMYPISVHMHVSMYESHGTDPSALALASWREDGRSYQVVMELRNLYFLIYNIQGCGVIVDEVSFSMSDNFLCPESI